MQMCARLALGKANKLRAMTLAISSTQHRSPQTNRVCTVSGGIGAVRAAQAASILDMSVGSENKLWWLIGGRNPVGTKA
jgi:hypothetical protein